MQEVAGRLGGTDHAGTQGGHRRPGAQVEGGRLPGRELVAGFDEGATLADIDQRAIDRRQGATPVEGDEGDSLPDDDAVVATALAKIHTTVIDANSAFSSSSERVRRAAMQRKTPDVSGVFLRAVQVGRR